MVLLQSEPVGRSCLQSVPVRFAPRKGGFPNEKDYDPCHLRGAGCLDGAERGFYGRDVLFRIIPAEHFVAGKGEWQ